MARKSEIYTWRVSPAMKTSLEEVARTRNRSVGELLEELVAEHLNVAGDPNELDIEKQRRLHARAATFLGTLSGGSAHRSERGRELVRARLKRRYRHAR